MSGRSRSGKRKPRSRSNRDRDRNRDSMGSGSMSMEMDTDADHQHQVHLMPAPAPNYGDPTKMPVVFVSANGDIQIAMSITGITCAQCVKMIETVLRGVDGSPSPIEGLLDAVGDKDLSGTIIKISKASDAKRIAFQASALLSMLGYKAVAREMDVVDNVNMDSLKLAYDVVAATDQKDVFDWKLKCSCPDNGIIRSDCVRHSQMNKRIFEAFDRREKQLKDHVSGCGRKNGLPCTCAPGTCKCKSGTCCAIKAEQIPNISNHNINPFGAGAAASTRMTLNQNTFSQHITTTQPSATQHQTQLGHFGSNFHQPQQQRQQPQQQQQQPQFVTLAAPTNIMSHTAPNFVQPHLTQSHPILTTIGQPTQAFNIQSTFPATIQQQHSIPQAQLSFQSQHQQQQQQQQQQHQQQYLMQLHHQQQQQQQQLALINLSTPIQQPSTEQSLSSLFHETNRKNGFDPPNSS